MLYVAGKRAPDDDDNNHGTCAVTAGCTANHYMLCRLMAIAEDGMHQQAHEHRSNDRNGGDKGIARENPECLGAPAR